MYYYYYYYSYTTRVKSYLLRYRAVVANARGTCTVRIITIVNIITMYYYYYYYYCCTS